MDKNQRIIAARHDTFNHEINIERARVQEVARQAQLVLDSSRAYLESRGIHVPAD